MVKPKTCRYCKKQFEPKTPKHIVCSDDCAIGMYEKQRTKQLHTQVRIERKELREKKQALKTRSYWIKEVQIVFNRYIRQRDSNNNCISCGALLVSEMVGGGYDAGHYLSRGAKPSLRFDERNCHGQCKRCNRYLSGNIANYREHLISRIGLKEVEALEADNAPRHYTIEDLKALKAHYQAKVKELERSACQ
jgi:hypothetical protein